MIPDELAELLAPLEAFEAMRRDVVHLGDRLCDFSYANPYDGVAESTRGVLGEALAQRRTLSLQYSPFGGQTRARRAVADSLRASHGLVWAYRDVVLAPGAMAGLQMALRLAGQPGDEVVIPVPAWLDYPLYARHVGLSPVLVPLEGPRFGLDVTALAAAITPRTCAVLLSQPANPTGRHYPATTWTALARCTCGGGGPTKPPPPTARCFSTWRHPTRATIPNSHESSRRRACSCFPRPCFTIGATSGWR